MPSQLQMAGSQQNNNVPLFTDRFFLGIVTNRNPLRSPLGAYYSKFITGNDALIDGNNTEISNRLTLIRRPGNTAGITNYLTSENVPDIPATFYSFHQTDGRIYVITDTPTAPYLITPSNVIPIFTKESDGGQGYYQGVGQTLYISNATDQQKWINTGTDVPDTELTANITATSSLFDLPTSTATITAANSFSVGQTVTITGSTNAGGIFNGTWVITAASSSDFQFSVPNLPNPGGSYILATDTGTATVILSSAAARISAIGNSFSSITGTSLASGNLVLTATITADSISLFSPITNTSSAAIFASNTFSPGQTVTIAGTANRKGILNGLWTIDVATSTYFTITIPASTALSVTSDTGTATVVVSGGGTSNTATITSQNNFQIGQTVVVSGTTNGSGIFNGTWVITGVTPNSFQFPLVHATVNSAVDTGFANATWNWGIAAPPAPPSIQVTETGLQAASWQTSTWFSTMGILIDSNSVAEQLVSVNADGSNPTTQFGLSGNGGPAWNQTPGQTTSDGSITWTNLGPIGVWQANTTYRRISVGGIIGEPAMIYDEVSGGFYANTGVNGGITGASKPHFNGIIGNTVAEPIAFGAAVWTCYANAFNPGNSSDPRYGTPMFVWQKNHVYAAGGAADAGLGNANSMLIEPYAPPPLGTPYPTNQIVYLQSSSGGTSSNTPYSPWGSAATPFGVSAIDNQLQWVSLGSSIWAATTLYTGWISSNSHSFNCVVDSVNCLQVCTQSGTSGTSAPWVVWKAHTSYVALNTITDTNGYLQQCTVAGTSGASAPSWSTTIGATTTEGGGSTVVWINKGPAYGSQTSDGSVIWTNAGLATNAVWTNNQQYYLPATGFSPSQPFDKYGGADILSATGTATITNVAVTSNVATITATNTFVVGNFVSITGLSHTILNITNAIITAATSSSFQFSIITANIASIADTGSATSNDVQFVINTGTSNASTQPTWNSPGLYTADNSQILWYNNGPFSAVSLAWSFGYTYAYSFKARSTSDAFLNNNPPTAPLGVGDSSSTFNSLSGLPTILPAPTGSADGSVSTASPTVSMLPVGGNSNAGAIITIGGLGSTDPQVDTIEIYRTTDGGGTLFRLTDIVAPIPIGGVAQPWVFHDTIPDVPTATSDGLGTLTIAATSHFNDPPPIGLINIVEHLGRIFGSVGSTVFCSEGPLVGGSSQPPGNGFTAFNPGQYWSFPAQVTRLVTTAIGLFVHTTSDLYIISGGPSITTLFGNILIPGLGLSSFNALAVSGSIINFMTADGQMVSLDPSAGVSEIGVGIGNVISNGVGGFNPTTSYLASLVQGSNDKALFLANGETGWYRCNPNQAPDSPLSGPVWSPFATIVGGCGAIGAVEYAAGKHALLIGATTANNPILARDSTFTTFTDNTSPYDAFATIGSIVLAEPGQLAELAFITSEFRKVGASPNISVLLDEISDSYLSISAATASGSYVTYTYNLISGILPVAGMTITITDMDTAGNNGTYEITSVSAGAFVVENSNGFTESSQVGIGTQFEPIYGYVSPVTGLPPQESPLKYGLTLSPNSIYANRYYFLQSINGEAPQTSCCRHLQIKIDYGQDVVENECLSLTIFGKHWSET